MATTAAPKPSPFVTSAALQPGDVIRFAAAPSGRATVVAVTTETYSGWNGTSHLFSRVHLSEPSGLVRSVDARSIERWFVYSGSPSRTV